MKRQVIESVIIATLKDSVVYTEDCSCNYCGWQGKNSIDKLVEALSRLQIDEAFKAVEQNQIEIKEAMDSVIKETVK